MWALWALVIALSIQAGTLDLVETPPVVSSLPVAVPNGSPLPLSLPTSPHHKSSSSSQGSPIKKHPAASKGGKCAPAARYFLSSGKLHDYLMNNLPTQIEDIVKCDDVGMAGVLGTLLATLDSADLLSLLDPSSLLKGAGGLGLDGLLGKEGNEDSSKPSSGSKATGGLNKLLPGGGAGLDSLLNLGGDKGSGKGLLKGEGLSSIKKPLNDMVENVDNIKDSVETKVKEILPSEIKDPVSDLLKINLKELLLEFQVDEVTVDSTDITMAADEIQVHSTVTATIGGKGVLGPVISALKFESDMEVTMKIAISSNNTQCVNLDIQDTHIQVNEMKIQLIETVTGTVPLPMSLPLNDLIPIVLSAEMNENLEKSNSCAIVLGDFNDCKNATGLFKYQVQSARISPKGLAILYCVEANLGKKSVPVPGRRLPPDPKDATISVTMSSSMLKILIIYVAKQSSVKMNGLDANITKIAYAFQKDKQLRISYEAAITKDSEDFATGKTQLIISHGSKITKAKLEPNIKLISSDHRVEPPEAEEEGKLVLSELAKAFWSSLNDMYKQMTIPEGVSSFALMNANIRPLKSSDLQATN
ncbi:vomeromodulin-like isoform X2 [Cricetulus griseus]|uniref:Vomeromodulin-like isoform X2 n=2 Tax=Cricetulus griseus TaxID=10029 RepID=A0A9J7JRT8_CRIGR|nr:vomeromodulin-like isoform X2 [Cricetulus griseus]